MMNMLYQILDLQWEDFSEETIERAKWVLIDTLFVMLSGIHHSPESRKFLRDKGVMEQDNAHSIRVPGTKTYLTEEHAAILFGTSIVCNEMDEGSQFAKGHPAAHLIPAMYIESARHAVSGKEFLRALIIGYEIAARFGYASKMKDEMHPHGTWGIIGAAAAVGLLQGKTKDKVINTVLLAASLPIATSWEAAVTGQTIRNLYTGLGNVIAHYVQNFEEAGFISSEHVVKHLWGNIMSNGVDEDLFLKNLNDPLLINLNYFKLYPACRFSHSAIEAFLQLKKRAKVDPKNIDSIEVETYDLSARLRDPSPQTQLGEKFSIPFLIAVLAHGFSLFDGDRDDIFYHSSVRKLALNIRVHANQSMSETLPEKRPAQVTVHLKNGEKLIGAVDDAPSGFEIESMKRLENKHRHIVGDLIDSSQWIEIILGIDNADNIQKIFEI
ncbi:MmgE/PrpD family protein [Sporolactobacillus laevolacticus]|uniref:MmgE/PrpD family protein n=1 Tax=Sporolactobacillus laevolacticus TaxID=33018 RepID=UPI0025B4CAE3|nr:MmgE/PrpD family protein [Sporolactobacillus laevolacticus]MDN3954815.1 MmgE/PrpD family protein [Sporolactobacillus laevolacticus]